MGRAPKPSHLRIVENTDRGKHGRGRGRRIDKEPVPSGDLSPANPPDHFSTTQRLVWKQTLEAAPAGLLRRLDGGLLAAWVVAYCLHGEANRKLNASSILIKGRNETVVKNPYTTVINSQAALMKSLAAELGFSPAARTRISLEAEDDGEDAAAHYFGR